MKKNSRLICRFSLGIALSHCLLGLSALGAHWTADMPQGKVELKSIGPIAFGPEGILFVADTKAAAIIAIATGDTKPAQTQQQPTRIERINEKIAALLGTAADQLQVNDLAVNPISRNIYMALSRGRNTEAIPVLLRVKTDGQMEVVELNKVSYSRAELPDAPVEGVVSGGNQRSNPRQESITDIAFLEDRLLVAGLSNEEFSSTLRAIPFPFKTVNNGASVEMYHGSHGRFETRSPIRTFVPLNVGNEPYVLAAYTCTPLVQFPIKEVQPGAKIKGKTIAELGNRNRPLDMIVYQKDGKDYLLLANNARGIMKISADDFASADNISTPVAGDAKKGVPYQTIESWKGVDQLDLFDSKNAIVLRKGDGGAINLESLPLP
jgi:hypothetical protein